MAFILLLGFFLWACAGHKLLHLALTDKADEMSVMWVTSTEVLLPQVQYGLSQSDVTKQLAYNTTRYTTGTYTSGLIHRAKLTGLLSGKKYFYRVGDASGDWTNFHAFVTDRKTPVSFFATGDIGTVPICEGCGQVVSQMSAYASKNPIDFVMHAGDISYANGNQPVWDDWQSQMQPITSTIPYMVAVGNHEQYDGWDAFRYRFEMPSQESHANDGNFYYSYNYGPIHFIVLNSESTSFDHSLPEYQWLQQDLASVNREATPWVFASYHRPWYCSNKAHPGSGDLMKNSYEDLFYKYKVDISFVGHTHAYERTLPMYKGSAVPDGIVTLVNGNGGTHEGSDKHWLPQPIWSASRGTFFGFGVATVFNSTHLHWQMIQASNGDVFDDWWFVRAH